jgi:hypothetical protein
MADRYELENSLTAALITLFREHEGKQFDPVRFRLNLERVIAPHLANTYRESWDELRNQGKIVLPDSAIIGMSSNRWVLEHAKVLAELIAARTQRELNRQQVSGKPVDLSSQFSPARAEDISVTETTRAITAGQYGLATAVVGLGMMPAEVMSPFWEILDNDACDLCKELDGKPKEVWAAVAPGGPPLHPHCRCSLRFTHLLLKASGERNGQQQIGSRDVHALQREYPSGGGQGLLRGGDEIAAR